MLNKMPNFIRPLWNESPVLSLSRTGTLFSNLHVRIMLNKRKKSLYLSNSLENFFRVYLASS